MTKSFSVTGNKISSLITDEDALKFSSASFNNVESFKEAFAKKLSLATKLQIKYDSIKWITKDDDDKNVSVKYRTSIGINGFAVFAFTDAADYELFFNYFEKEKHYFRSQETLTPLRAIRNYLIGFLVTIAITIFCYYQAIEIANGTVEPTHSGKEQLFNTIVGSLGVKGVLGIGGLISCWLLYKIWTRFSNPPNQLKFLPTNA